QRARGREAHGSAAFWLGLRLLPAAASTAFVVVVFLPSYWTYEPRAVEDLDATLALLAFASLACICAAAARGCAAWWRASRWAPARGPVAALCRARPPALDSGIPVYTIPAPPPMMALVGVIRPRLIVTRGVVSALTIDELRAGVAHEIGHLRAWDNLKRLAMA